MSVLMELRLFSCRARLRADSPFFSYPFLDKTPRWENSCCGIKLLTVHVGRTVKSSTCLVPFVIYCFIGAVFSIGYFFAMALTVCKPNRVRNGGPKGCPHPHPAHFSALILLLQCRHPIQLGSVMGLL